MGINDSSCFSSEFLQDAIDEINKLEKGLKSGKTLGDLLVLCYNMSLSSIGLQLDVFRSWLQHEGVLPRAYNISDLLPHLVFCLNVF
jgi:hypothetical protein